HRQQNPEGRSLPRTGARDLDVSAVQLHDVTDYSETETETGVRARRPAVALPKSIEHERQHRRIDPFTGIGDRDFHVAVPPADADSHFSAAGRELDRVRQKIPDDL